MNSPDELGSVIERVKQAAEDLPDEHDEEVQIEEIPAEEIEYAALDPIPAAIAGCRQLVNKQPDEIQPYPNLPAGNAIVARSLLEPETIILIISAEDFKAAGSPGRLFGIKVVL